MKCSPRRDSGLTQAQARRIRPLKKCTTPLKETFVREGHKEKGKVVSGKATRGMPSVGVKTDGSRVGGPELCV